MASTIFDRRALLKGFAAVAGTAILAACGGSDTTATTASTTGTTASGGAATTGSGAATTGSSAATTSSGAATTASTSGSAAAATRPATTGSAAAGASTAATTAPTTAATTGSATAGATTAATAATSGSATTGTVTGSAPAMMAAATGGMPMGPTMAMCMTGSIVALGSTALQPVVDAASKAYMSKCMGAQINVQGGGSGTGLTQVFGGQATIGDSDLFAEDANGIDAKMLEDHQVCIEPFAMAANPNVGISNLTQDQVISIWTGKVTNYKDVGGKDQPIVIINRPASSGTRGTFRQFALKGANEAQGKALTEDSSGAVAQAIKDTPGAIGYLALAYFKQDMALKTIMFNGKTPTIENMSDDSYPIWAYGHMYTKGPAMGLAKAFIDYLLSADVQNNILPSVGYFSVSQVKAMHKPASAM